MGQDYMKNVYRKNYDGDYVKSYEDRVAVKREQAERIKSYKEITQKQGSYNKKEKGIYDPGNTERTMDVFDQPKTKISERKRTSLEKKRETAPIVENSKSKKTKPINNLPSLPKQTEQTTIEVSTVEQKTAVYEVKQDNFTDSETIYNKSKVKSRDYEAYRKMVIVPIQVEGSGIYRELKNKELVDEKEARYILDYAGYKQKPDMEYVRFAIIAFAAAIIIGYVGALLALAWSYFYRQRNYIVLEKKSSMSNLSIRMPATKDELKAMSFTGNIYLYISVAMFAVAFLKSQFF